MVAQINALIGRDRKSTQAHRAKHDLYIFAFFRVSFSRRLATLFFLLRHSQIETRNQSRHGLESIFHFNLARAALIRGFRVMKVH